MRALALALSAEGLRVAGSDRDLDSARELEIHGIRIVPEAETAEARGSDLVIYSSAIPSDHAALQAAQKSFVPVMKRARALGAIVNDRLLAAVAGTHGKTTVTSMLGLVAEDIGMDPLALVGGHVASWGSNMRSGSGLAVVEADEFDRSFLELDPDIAIVTSVEAEHLDCYGDLQTLELAFETFAGRAARLLVCADDPGSLRLVDLHSDARTYGFAPQATYRVEVIDVSRNGQSCMLYHGSDVIPFRLGSPGAHNAQNAAAALAAALWLGAEKSPLASSLEGFLGAHRRLQVLHESPDLVVIDDYAHHPTEVKASLAAVRSGWPGHRVTVVFQPHLYSRTKDLADGFAAALEAADDAYVLPIYGARETPIPGVTHELITGARPRLSTLEPGDVSSLITVKEPTAIVFMGAGNVTDMAHAAANEADRSSTDALGD
jgi:UDP-N-acetylmuramate--alanine ligase